MKVHWPAAVLLALAAVLACTLFPFRLSAANVAHRRLPDVLGIGFGIDRSFDVVTNLLLFLPLGVAGAGVLGQRRVGTLRVIAIVVIASGTISYAIEIVQQFIPGRFASLTDVAANTAGGTIGAIYYRVWRKGRAEARSSTRRAEANLPEGNSHERDCPVSPAHD